MIDLLKKIIENYGIKEYKGEKANPRILRWIKTRFPKATDDSEYAWCSIFMNVMAEKCGYETTGSSLARSWLKVGYESPNPEPGDVVVFWRRKLNSKWGHVGVYINETKTHIRCLGGNQSNSVNIVEIPKYRLLSIRKLNKIYTHEA